MGTLWSSQKKEVGRESSSGNEIVSNDEYPPSYYLRGPKKDWSNKDKPDSDDSKQ